MSMNEENMMKEQADDKLINDAFQHLHKLRTSFHTLSGLSLIRIFMCNIQFLIFCILDQLVSLGIEAVSIYLNCGGYSGIYNIAASFS